MPPGRKRILIDMQFNQDTGQIERFVIDDQDRAAPEDRHDEIARTVAALFERNPETEDIALHVRREQRTEPEPTQQQRETLDQADGDGTS